MRQIIAKAGLLLIALTLMLGGCIETREQREQRINQLLNEAEAHLDEGLTDSALAKFGLALEENPDLIEAQMGMGNIWRQRGDYTKAKLAFEAATEINPNDFDARYYLGHMQHLLGEVENAIRTYLQALAIDPDSHVANRDLAAAYLQTGKPGNALTYARKATELNPDSQESWSNLAACYSLLGEYESAVDAYRQAAELGPLAEPVLLGLADAHIRLGNYTRAINTLDALLRESPSSTAYERLGFAQFKMREFEKALRNFRRALKLDEDDTAALNGVGVCLMTLYIEGDRTNPYQRDQALDAWRDSLKVRPDQPRIVDLLYRYSKI